MLTPMPKRDGEIECPLCQSNVSFNEFKIAENNLLFLLEHSAGGTLDEALTILRLLIEKVPGIKIDVSNKSALEEYFKKIQEQIALTVVTPIGLLVENANLLMEKMSKLTESVPADIKEEFNEVNKELSQKLESMEKSTTEAPLIMFNGTLNPLMEKLGQLIDRLPKDIKEGFKEVKTDLQEKLVEIKTNTEKSDFSIGCEVRELRNSINSLINKPTTLGRVGEGVIAESWKAEFAQDILEPKGGAGEPDALVVPYLGMNGGDYGRKISLERKAGSQKYSGKHLEEVCRHARKYGATQAMLVYDTKTNLPEAFRPMRVLFRPQEKLTIAVTCLEERTWVTAREVLEVLQIADPPEDESKNLVDLIELDKAVADLQTVNAIIDKLRKANNTALRTSESMRTQIDELEKSILSYQTRLRQVLEKRSSRIE